MITDRILQIIEYKDITIYRFCKDLEFSPSFLNKPREISSEKCAKILFYFPDINPMWFLSGEGEMIKPEENGNIMSNLSNESSIISQGKISINDNFHKVVSDKDNMIRELYLHSLTSLKEKDDTIREKELHIEKITQKVYNRNEEWTHRLEAKEENIKKLFEQIERLQSQNEKLQEQNAELVNRLLGNVI